jgi:HEAT repeat protein
MADDLSPDPDRLRAFEENPVERVRRLRSAGDVAGLIRELDNPRDFGPVGFRGWAAKALGEMGAEDAVPALADLASDELEDVRVFAVVALGQIGGAAVLPALLHGLEDPSNLVKQWSAHSLGTAKLTEATGALADLLGHPSRRVRQSAATALARLGDQSAIAPLTAAAARERWPWNRPFKKALRELRQR